MMEINVFNDAHMFSNNVFNGADLTKGIDITGADRLSLMRIILNYWHEFDV